jgi:hypothetical protein
MIFKTKVAKAITNITMPMITIAVVSVIHSILLLLDSAIAAIDIYTLQEN